MAHKKFSSKERRGILLLLAIAALIILIRVAISAGHSDVNEKEWRPFVPIATHPPDIATQTGDSVSKPKKKHKKSRKRSKGKEKKESHAVPARNLLRDSIPTRR